MAFRIHQTVLTRCIVCGTRFETRHPRPDRARFCSSECRQVAGAMCRWIRVHGYDPATHLRDQLKMQLAGLFNRLWTRALR